MKRILVDGTSLALQMKGVGRYTLNILTEFDRTANPNQFSVLIFRDQTLPILPQGEHFQYIQVSRTNHYLHGWLTIPQMARRMKVESAWIPAETTLGNMPCPYAVVCHDVPRMIHTSQETAGARFSKGRRLVAGIDTRLVRRALRQAKVVFANSHFVGAWLRQELHLGEQQVQFAPCAPGADFAALSAKVNPEAVRDALNCPNGYVLVFATGDRRENLETVLRVFDGLAGQTDLNFVIAGTRGREAEDIRAQVQIFEWNDRVRILPFFGESETQELANVYAGATIYLDLSLHEGFGMQVIEAMACGTPVVCSNRAALPEVAGNAAHLVDPLDAVNVDAAILYLERNGNVRAELSRQGRENARRYRWRNSAQVIAEVLAAL